MAMQESNQINHDQTPEPASNLGATLLRANVGGAARRHTRLSGSWSASYSEEPR